jgi:hypothetical protein
MKPWGIAALVRNLARRGLLPETQEQCHVAHGLPFLA